MTRIDALMVATTAKSQAVKYLQEAQRKRSNYYLGKSNVRAALETLHLACELFGQGDPADEHEDLYLPLLDARSWCADGMCKTPFFDDQVEKALVCLYTLDNFLRRETRNQLQMSDKSTSACLTQAPPADNGKGGDDHAL